MSTDKKTIDWYNENADNYTKHVRDPKDSVFHSLYEKPAMYRLIPNIEDKTVISLGCGSGEDSNKLKEFGARRSVGVDISKELIKIAKNTYPKCEFKVMDMGKLDYPNELFDFAYSSLAIHYLKSWQPVFKEVYRVLKNDSNFLFSFQHPVRPLAELSKQNHLVDTDDYLKTRSFDNSLKLNAKVTTWYKPLGEIISEATQSGFMLTDFVEPKPLKQMKEISPEDYKQLMKVPDFAVIKLVKT